MRFSDLTTLPVTCIRGCYATYPVQCSHLLCAGLSQRSQHYAREAGTTSRFILSTSSGFIWSIRLFRLSAVYGCFHSGCDNSQRFVLGCDTRALHLLTSGRSVLVLALCWTPSRFPVFLPPAVQYARTHHNGKNTGQTVHHWLIRFEGPHRQCSYRCVDLMK